MTKNILIKTQHIFSCIVFVTSNTLAMIGDIIVSSLTNVPEFAAAKDERRPPDAGRVEPVRVLRVRARAKNKHKQAIVF
jgi:hypothetical protein